MIRKIKGVWCKIASAITKKEYVVDTTGIILRPSTNGQKCRGNGLHKDLFGRTIACCCDACDYFLKCYHEFADILQGEHVIYEKRE